MKTNFSQMMTVAAAMAVGQTQAFWGTAHLIVSRQAQAFLQSEHPAALTSALAELAVLKESHASIVKENLNPFTECAVFADAVKSQYSFQADWHFVDQPYLDKGGSLSDFSFVASANDVAGALQSITDWLSGNGTAYKSSYYYQQIIENFPVEADARSFALRLLVHFVGDIHQPLHTVAEVDSTYPSGDKGGNAETLPSICGASNLHAMWDSVAYNYCGNPTLPLSTSDWTFYTNEASAMFKAYPTTSSQLYDGNFTKWAQEGLALSKIYVYPVTAGKALSDTYVSNANTQTRIRMMYGARRLADLIVAIYGSEAEETDAFNFLQ